jgi:hypothetical protein
VSQQFKWTKIEGECAFRAVMPDHVTLIVTPDRTTNRGSKPFRGTFWHAQASKWIEKHRTLQRFGRDIYSIRHPSAKDAMRSAENIYLNEIERRKKLQIVAS